MKNMLKRLVALAAALTMVLSVTAITCSAAYFNGRDDGGIETYSDRPSDNSTRN